MLVFNSLWEDCMCAQLSYSETATTTEPNISMQISTGGQKISIHTGGTGFQSAALNYRSRKLDLFLPNVNTKK